MVLGPFFVLKITGQSKF